MGKFTDFMGEKRLVDRWLLLVAALIGGFCGALLMALFAILGILPT